MAWHKANIGSIFPLSHWGTINRVWKVLLTGRTWRHHLNSRPCLIIAFSNWPDELRHNGQTEIKSKFGHFLTTSCKVCSVNLFRMTGWFGIEEEEHYLHDCPNTWWLITLNGKWKRGGLIELEWKITTLLAYDKATNWKRKFSPSTCQGK